MARFLIGDSLGNIKHVQFTTSSEPIAYDVKTLSDGIALGQNTGVHLLAMSGPDLVSHACVFLDMN
jgi:hypothetical protein